MKNPKLFSIDWLQLFCARPASWEPRDLFTSPCADMYGNHRDYYLAPAKEYLKGYAEQRRIVWRKYDICTIAWNNVDPRVNSLACAIKISNPVLYVAEWRFICEDVLRALNWQPLSITRVDLCCDFNKFDCGVDPRVFMRRYACDRSAKFDTFVRVGSDKFHIDGAKRVDLCDVQTIRWGSRQNGVSTYMYNKSLEMAQKKYKQYIVRAWESAGLVYQDPKHPVWRVEFSISSKGVHIEDLELGSMKKLWLTDFDDEQKIRDLWLVYASKFFRFKVVPPTSEKLVKKQNLDDWQPFDTSDVLPLRPRSMCVCTDSGRTERLISSRLARMADNLEVYNEHAGVDFSLDIENLRKCVDSFDSIADIKSWRRDFEAFEEKHTEHKLTKEDISGIVWQHRKESMYAFVKSQESILFNNYERLRRKRSAKSNGR